MRQLWAEILVSRKTLLIVLGVIALIAAAGIGYYFTSESSTAAAGSGQGDAARAPGNAGSAGERLAKAAIGEGFLS